MKALLLIIFALTLILQSCRKCEQKEYVFTTEERTWIPDISIGDSVKFELKGANLARYLVVNVRESGEYGDEDLCKEGKYNWGSRIGGGLSFGVFISKKESNFSKTFGFRGILFHDFPYVMSDVKINGSLYSDVYVNTVSVKEDSTTNLYTIYFIKGPGLVRFDKNDTEIWERQNF